MQMTPAHSSAFDTASTTRSLIDAAEHTGGDLAEGLRLADAAVRMARTEDAGDELLGRSLLLRARFAYRQLDYALAYESALAASQRLAKGSDVSRQARALNYCFIVCIETGDLVRAMQYADRALAMAALHDLTALRATVLHNQAVVFEMIEDECRALDCLDRAARLYDQVAAGEPGAFFARVNAAGIHLQRMERAQREGAMPDEVDAHRALAQQVLPALLAGADLAAVQRWLAIQVRLGNLVAARQAASLCLQRARRRASRQRDRTLAMMALADLHQGMGHHDRAALCLRRAVDKLRAAHNQSHLAGVEHRLAGLYAALGAHAQALQWERQAQRDSLQMSAERRQLRWSFAEADREARSRRSLAGEMQHHAQRLDLIGRLIAEIDHALAEPLAVVRERLRPWDPAMSAASPDADAVLPPQTELTQRLCEVIDQVDAASALVGQLKIFSYRASPQPSEVNLPRELAQAWSDTALWRRGRNPPLQIELGPAAIVHVDARRLAVLLRILLIELARATQGHGAAARIELHPSGCELHLRSRAQVQPEIASASLTKSPEALSVGVMLCEEIAHEIGGALWQGPAEGGSAQVLYRLSLPLWSGSLN